MKKIIFGFALIFLFGINAFSQSGEDIIDKYITAVGGADNWSAIKSQKLTGKLNRNGMEFPLVTFSKRPNMTYREVSIQDYTMKQAFDGTTGWMINPKMDSSKAKKMDEEMTKTIKNGAIIGGQLINYKELGCSLELIGKEDMEGKQVYNIKLTNKDSEIENYFIDAESFLILKKTSKMSAMGQEISIETFYTNYKPAGNVIVAYSVESKISGAGMDSQKVDIDKIEQNIEIDDNLFRMPEEGNK